jgi:isopenicillin-N epimerase
VASPTVDPFAASPAPDQPAWRLDPSVTHLNHGSFGACPEPVLEAQRIWRDRMETEPVRFLARDLEGHLDEARRTVAAFLGADAEDLAFVPNATTGVSTVLASLRFSPGDELLATDHEYNASLNALRGAADRDGASVALARIPFPIRDASEAVDAILEAVTPRTRLALISHITSPTALVLPITAIVRELNRRGIDTLVDGAHAPGQVPVDLGAIGAAFWTGNGHKWLCGPKGAAMLHVRRDRRDLIRPLSVSHGANDPRTDRSRFRLQFDWTGTADPSPYLSLPAAIRFVGGLHRYGWKGLMAANGTLARRGRDLVCSALSVDPPAPDSMLAAMAAIPLPGIGSRAAAERLAADLYEEDRIEVAINLWPVAGARDPGEPARYALLRVSAQAYNRIEDYQRLAESLRRRLADRSPRSLLGRLRRG